MILADLPAMGRLWSGAELIYDAVNVETARDPAHETRIRLYGVIGRLLPIQEPAVADKPKMFQEELISGIISSCLPD